MKGEIPMVFKTFDELIAAAKSKPSTARMAVAAAGDSHTIEAVLMARAEGIAEPVLVGDKAGLESVRVNDQYRIEFKTTQVMSEIVITVCNVIELSNHYK